MFRSVIAIITGYLSMSLLVMTSFAIIMVIMPDALPEPSVMPATSFLILVLILGLFYAVIGGYLTALIAQRSHFKHVIFLAGIVLGLGILNMFAEYGTMPFWYLLIQVFTGIIGVLSGGKIRLTIKPVKSG
ncbi:MAG: hypothetical protein V3W18_07530 [candidate division Zixibacteria bacterium]